MPRAASARAAAMSSRAPLAGPSPHTAAGASRQCRDSGRQGGGPGKVEPGDGGAGVEPAAPDEVRRDDPAPHPRRGARRQVHGGGAVAPVPVQQRQQPGRGRQAQPLAAAAAAACAAAERGVGGRVGGAGEGDVLHAAAGEGARVVVAAVEAGDGGDAQVAEEVRVVVRAEDAAAAVDVGPRRAGGEAGVGGRGAEEEDAVGDDGEDLAVDGAGRDVRADGQACAGMPL